MFPGLLGLDGQDRPFVCRPEQPGTPLLIPLYLAYHNRMLYSTVGTGPCYLHLVFGRDSPLNKCHNLKESRSSLYGIYLFHCLNDQRHICGGEVNNCGEEREPPPNDPKGSYAHGAGDRQVSRSILRGIRRFFTFLYNFNRGLCLIGYRYALFSVLLWFFSFPVSVISFTHHIILYRLFHC